MSDTPTGYEPLYELKTVAPDVWIVDGPWIRFYGFPFPTRMTVIRLPNGDVWAHSPIEIGNGLDDAISAIGPVRYLVAPNWIHYAWVSKWQERFPDAVSFVSPGVSERAATRGIELHSNEELGDDPAAQWADTIDQCFVESGYHKEVVFFHRPTRTLILTDLIENMEKDKMPWWTRPLLKLGGVCAPNGGMPRDMAASFKRRLAPFRIKVAQMIAWNPERVIIAHGKWFEQDGVDALNRAFRRFFD